VARDGHYRGLHAARPRPLSTASGRDATGVSAVAVSDAIEVDATNESAVLVAAVASETDKPVVAAVALDVAGADAVEVTTNEPVVETAVVASAAVVESAADDDTGDFSVQLVVAVDDANADADADAFTGVITNETIITDDAVDDAEAVSCVVTDEDAVATKELIFCETGADAITGTVTDRREILKPRNRPQGVARHSVARLSPMMMACRARPFHGSVWQLCGNSKLGLCGYSCGAGRLCALSRCGLLEVFRARLSFVASVRLAIPWAGLLRPSAAAALRSSSRRCAVGH
jgi:hypothetical protein